MCSREDSIQVFLSMVGEPEESIEKIIIIQSQYSYEDIYGKTFSELEYQCEPVSIEVLDVLPKTDILLRAISDYSVVQSKYEDAVYFYHGDHLGSTNWITDRHGTPVQYIHYAPFGELIEDQRNGYDTQFKFTGKERDAETGYDYFGARFFLPAFSHWLSVDPFSDKYPGISPYAYCGWNPIKYVDPDGKDYTIAIDEDTCETSVCD